MVLGTHVSLSALPRVCLTRHRAERGRDCGHKALSTFRATIAHHPTCELRWSSSARLWQRRVIGQCSVGVPDLVNSTLAIPPCPFVSALPLDREHIQTHPFFVTLRALSRMSSMTTTEVKPTRANIGVYTNPAHDLWVADALPSQQEVESGATLKPGEVTIAIKSTGICG